MRTLLAFALALAECVPEPAPVPVTPTPIATAPVVDDEPPLPKKKDKAQAPQAPALSLSGFDGQTVALAPGKVNLVTFWASWCAPCAQSLPYYQRLADANPELAVALISEDDDDLPARAYVRALGVRAPAALDEDHSIADAWQPPSMPTTYLVDKRGAVRFVHPGWDGETLDDEVRRLLRE